MPENGKSFLRFMLKHGHKVCRDHIDDDDAKMKSVCAIWRWKTLETTNKKIKMQVAKCACSWKDFAMISANKYEHDGMNGVVLMKERDMFSFRKPFMPSVSRENEKIHSTNSNMVICYFTLLCVVIGLIFFAKEWEECIKYLWRIHFLVVLKGINLSSLFFHFVTIKAHHHPPASRSVSVHSTLFILKQALHGFSFKKQQNAVLPPQHSKVKNSRLHIMLI